MLCDHISVRETFLNAELRDGVQVSAELKSVWKVMLNLFEEFSRICEKYDLKYCLDGGSLLGAVRHGGFVPWDDDMDITLPRKDFERFLEVAPHELPREYFCQYTTTDPWHFQGFACLRHSKTAAIDLYWAKKKALFNMGIGIDIFPLDDIADDDLVVQAAVKRYNAVFGRLYDHKFGPRKKGLRRIEQNLLKVGYFLLGNQRLTAWRDRIWAQWNGKQCSRCSTISYNRGRETGIWDKRIFQSRRKVPFEYLDAYIPMEAEVYLDTHYGSNWRTPVRGAGDHEPLILDVNRPFKEILADEFGYSNAMLSRIPE